MRNVILILISTYLSVCIDVREFTQQDYCDRFLACELNMMEIHRRCTNNSRSEVAQTCGLVSDFNELSRLMQARVNEFSACVRTESIIQEQSLDRVEVNAEECQIKQSTNEDIAKSCWESVGRAKEHCQRLQACCIPVKKCIRVGKNSPLTLALREKHSIINARTSECRKEMRAFLRTPHTRSDPVAIRARGVLLAQGEKIFENIIQEDELEKLSEPKRLETTAIRMPIDNMHQKMTALVAQLSKMVLNESASKETILPPKILIKKRKKHHKHDKEEPVLPSDTIRNIVYKRPRFSFSLPSTVNLTKLNVFAARPELLHNSTSPPSNYHIRKPLPPNEPPTFKVDSGTQHVMTSRLLMPSDENPQYLEPIAEKFVDAETENRVDWDRKRARLFAANRPKPDMVQLHLIKQLRHKHSQETTTAMPDDDVELIKLLRRMKLKPDESTKEMSVKKTHVFDITTTESPQTSTITVNQIKIPENVVFVDQSTEQGLFVKADVSRHQQFQFTTTQAPQLKAPLRSGTLFKHMRTLPDDEATKPLYGYRNKVLNIKQREDESGMSTNNITFERTTVAYAPSRVLTLNTTDVLVPINWKEIRRSPQKNVENTELAQVQIDLIRNLEEYLEKQAFDRKHQMREQIQMEEKRLALLRRERAEFERLGRNTGYCELYSTCMDQLKFVQSQCQQQTQKEASDFFKFKFGSCNARLFKQYQETDQLRVELLDIFENCIIEEIAIGNAKTLSICAKEWPILSVFDDKVDCSEKKRLIHSHCTSLGKCCDSLKICKEEVAKHELFQKLSSAKHTLNQSAQKCKLSVTTKPPSRTETILPLQETRLI